MSNASYDYEKQQTSRSLDTICIHNITDEDFTYWYDKHGPAAAKTLIPAQTKDIGFGPGNAHLPRYKAEIVAKDMIEKKINAISDAKWAKDSKVYRTRDEKLQHASSEQIRTNDATLWNEFFPKVWLGVVEKFGNLDLPDPTDERPVDTGSAMGDVLKKTGLADKPYESQTASA